MLEVLEYYQSLAQKFQSQLLTGPGIIVVLAGLCIWLAGLRWRRVVGALVGAAVAAAGVFVIGNYPAGVVLTACAIGLFAGVIINRIVFGIFGAAVGVLVVMVVLAGGLTAGENESSMIEFQETNKTYNPDEITADDFVAEFPYPTWPEYEQSGVVIDAPAALEITTKMAEYFFDRAKKAVASAGAGGYAGAGLVAVIAVIAALIMPRLFIAVISSSLGSAVIFTGMIMLLFYKGSKPISYISERPWFYATAFGAMVIFGTAAQLILSPPAAKQSQTDSPDKEIGSTSSL
jgi:hypothetical protein